MSKRANWYAIHHRNMAYKAERVRIMGEELKDETISGEGILELSKLKTIAERVYLTCGRGLPERVYHDYMVELMLDEYSNVIQEARQPCVINGKACGTVIPDILASNENGEYVIEVKIGNVSKGLLQLSQYVLNTSRIGFLVCYGISGVDLYMILSVSDSECVCYYDTRLYKMNLNAPLRQNSEGTLREL